MEGTPVAWAITNLLIQFYVGYTLWSFNIAIENRHFNSEKIPMQNGGLCRCRANQCLRCLSGCRVRHRCFGFRDVGGTEPASAAVTGETAPSNARIYLAGFSGEPETVFNSVFSRPISVQM